MTERYHIGTTTTPWCDYTGCQAGHQLAEKAGVHQCGYGTLAAARQAMRRINTVDGYAGFICVRSGPCPNYREADQ